MRCIFATCGCSKGMSDSELENLMLEHVVLAGGSIGSAPEDLELLLQPVIPT
jgi:hypothetical protein